MSDLRITRTSAFDFGPGTSEVCTEGWEGSSGIKSTVLNPLCTGGRGPSVRRCADALIAARRDAWIMVMGGVVI